MLCHVPRRSRNEDPKPGNLPKLTVNETVMRLGLLLVPIVLLVGCATPPSIPPELQYVVPAGQKSSLATLVGSQEKSPLFTDFTTYVLAVDGKHVMSGPQGWSTPLPIQPGLRNITVAFLRAPLNTQVDLQLQAVTGGRYQIQFSTDAQFFGTNKYCDFWIVDIATQKPVTGIRRGNLINSIRYSPPVDD